MGNACDGWEPIRLRQSSIDFLASKDLPAAGDVLGHNEHGEKIGCWKAGH